MEQLLGAGGLVAGDADEVAGGLQVSQAGADVGVEVSAVEVLGQAGVGPALTFDGQVEVRPEPAERLAVVPTLRERLPKTVEKVCRGTPSQSAQAWYSVLSSTSVSPTSKNTAVTAGRSLLMRRG